MTLRRREFLGVCALAGLSACGGRASRGDILSWGDEGLRDGSFLRPRAIGLHDGKVYVIDTTGRVQVFSESGEFLAMWSTPDAKTGTPTAIGFRDGRVIIPDTHYSRILEYSPEGKLLEQWGSYGSGPDQFIYPTGVAFGPGGSYYFSEYGENAERVHVFDATRKFARQWGEHGDQPGQFNRAMAIATNTVNGLVYVSDTANHRVQCFTPEGTLVRIIGEPGTGPGQLKFPYAMALGPDGTCYACEYGNHRVSRFDLEGKLISTFGGPGRGLGEFNDPRGVAIAADGTVYVADTENHRIQRIPAGAFA